ncbi:D-2-hydroxyacid dehydrogenase [Acuticoccus sp. I52.16.1]|uniref:D-2-hydroxyacid dehydrogenase n=1 Tax=Acuticoccus sp. I52.16.1 TaxID=2928472 RepID=UPI001FD19B8A|nr:D-2-hydroxyacid dehydrogenase [Acuticoccus sp. I52.16.1]UOM32610.1 D-2-hydroxyacid dehydrogenase [Acuticoccus sp. I52.16.1]
MTRIVFLDRATIAPQIRLGRPAFPHTWIEYDGTGPEETAARLAGATIAITNKVRIDTAVLDAAPDLACVVVAATGTDCVDTAACTARGIPVCNIRGYSTATVPEHVFTLLLGLRRGLTLYAREVRDGAWQRAGQFCFFAQPIRDLRGATMGVIGAGGIGTRVGELAAAFGMNVLYSARRDQTPAGNRVGFEEFLARADVISLHCPLRPDTRHLLGAEAFAAMKRSPIVINTARGALVDLEALESALDSGRVGGAGIDVASVEPPPADDILMRLAERPNVIVTPHVAWASDEAQQVLADQLVEVLEAYARNAPINMVAAPMVAAPQ